MRVIPLLTGLVFLTTMFAGCAGDEGAAKASPSTTAAPATVTAETGSIAGQVVTDELMPVAGAEVGLIDGSSATTVSDAQGKFTFNDLVPGTYKVVSAKLGFEAAAPRSVDVVAGEVANVNFQLKPIDISKDPYQLHEELVGFFNAGACAAGVTVRPGYLGATPNERSIFDTNVTDGANLMTTVDTMVWDATSPGSAMLFYLDHKIDGTTKNTVRGKSPLVSRLDEPEVKKKGGKLNHWVWLYCTTADPTSAVTFVLQQKFMIYVDHFYHAEAPLDFSGLPPS